MLNSQTLRCARKVLTLAVMLGALGFLTFDTRIFPVKAVPDDCNAAFTYLQACYYGCTVSTACGGVPGDCSTCYSGCEAAHAWYGTVCGLPNYSPMLHSSYSCARNSDQLLANCIAGQLPPLWQQRYLDQLVLQGGDMDAACTQMVWDYQNAECY